MAAVHKSENNRTVSLSDKHLIRHEKFKKLISDEISGVIRNPKAALKQI